MTEPDATPGREDLANALRAMQKTFYSELRSVTPSWQWGILHTRIGIRGRVASGLITTVYVGFNVLCFATGVLLILLGNVEQTIGIALMVGSIFSFGAFVAQFWAVAVQQESDVRSQVFGADEQIAKLRDLHQRIEELSRTIEGKRTADDAL